MSGALIMGREAAKNHLPASAEPPSGWQIPSTPCRVAESISAPEKTLGVTGMLKNMTDHTVS